MTCTDRFFESLCSRHPWVQDLDQQKLFDLVDYAFNQGLKGLPIDYDSIFSRFQVLRRFYLSQVQLLVSECLLEGKNTAETYAEDDAEEEPESFDEISNANISRAWLRWVRPDGSGKESSILLYPGEFEQFIDLINKNRSSETISGD